MCSYPNLLRKTSASSFLTLGTVFDLFLRGFLCYPSFCLLLRNVLFCFQTLRSLGALLLRFHLLPFLPCALVQGTQCISRCHSHTHLDHLVLSSPSCLPASGGVGFKSRRATKTGVLFITLSSAFRVHQTSKRDTSAECSFIFFPYKRVPLFSSL